MGDTNESKRAKERSPVFPFINLEQALNRARQFYDEEKRGVAPFPRVAMHWGYSPLSSGALQTVSALKNYGLLTEVAAVGASKDRQFQLSELALRIILDQREDSPDKDENIRLAAMRPAVAEEVYSRWRDGLPKDSTLRHYLVLDRKFNESTAIKVVKILRENHFLGWAKSPIPDATSESVAVPENRVVEEKTVTAGPPPGATQLVGHAPTVLISGPTGSTAARAAHMEQLTSLDGKLSVTMHFSDTADADFYEWIATYVTMKANALKKTAMVKQSEGRVAGESQEPGGSQ